MSSGLPNLFATHLGWLVAGDVNYDACEFSSYNCVFLANENKNDDTCCNFMHTMEKLWIISDLENSEWTLEELECEKQYVKNIVRDKQSNVKVKNPFRVSPYELGETKSLALKRFYT